MKKLKKILINKFLLLPVLTFLPAASLSAENNVWDDFKETFKIGGYGIARYTYNDRAGQTTNGGFDFRYVRLYTDGKLLDFNYKFQMELYGLPNASTGKGARLLDAWAEWAKYKEFKVKGGQFKRSFSFEAPYNPWDVGLNNYSGVISKLTGFPDRCGELTTGGRDIGVQVQGDLFPSKVDGHRFIHYQLGVFNGQGINSADVDKKKDIIGGLWFSPVDKLNIGAFGWAGTYARKGTDGKVVSVDRNRMDIGLKYESDWTVRGEYITSVGKAFKGSTGTEIDEARGNKSDGWYATVGVPVIKNKLKIYGKWDVYRDKKEMSTATQSYVCSINYYLCKNLKVQGTYSYTHDKNVAVGQNYNTIDVQLYWRF